MDVCRCGAVAQVAIYHQHPPALHGKGCGDVQGQESLAAAGVERGNQRDAGFVLIFPGIEHELQVGAQYPEGFVDNIAVALPDDQRFGRMGLLLFPGCALCQRYFSGKRQRQTFQIFASTHLRIHILAEEDDHHGNQQAEGEGYQSDVLLDRRSRYHAARGRRDDTGVIGRERLRQFILLALLQQEEVKGFLHLLLAFHRKQILSLCRIGGNTGCGLPFALLQGP